MTSSIKNNSVLFILCVFFGILSAKAQNTITIHPTSETIKIDGEVTEAIWQQHLQEGNFTQQRPDNGKPSKRKTEIAILHDQSYLYVLGIFHVENQTEINKQLTARDDIGTTDFLGFKWILLEKQEKVMTLRLQLQMYNTTGNLLLLVKTETLM